LPEPGRFSGLEISSGGYDAASGFIQKLPAARGNSTEQLRNCPVIRWLDKKLPATNHRFRSLDQFQSATSHWFILVKTLKTPDSAKKGHA
jgi:hypothetical protein